MSGATVLLGMGNLLYGDEGVGVLAVHGFARTYRTTPAVEIVDGGLLGFRIVDLFLGASTLVVVDAVAADAPAGTILRLPAEELRHLAPDVRPTAHEVDPLQLLHLAPVLGGPDHVVLLGLVPAQVSGGVGLSPAAAAAFPALVDAAAAELAAHGVRCDQVARPTVQDVVDSLISGAR